MILTTKLKTIHKERNEEKKGFVAEQCQVIQTYINILLAMFCTTEKSAKNHPTS